MSERTLVLLRHAKAEAPTGPADASRPLTARGHADAGAAGAWLAGHGHRPDLVICSPAKRTRQTWHAVSVALTEGEVDQPTVHYEKSVYDSGARDLIDLIRDIGDEVTSVLVIGHNPTISQVSALLDPESGVDSDGLRTAGIAVHQVPGSWHDCGSQRAPLTATHTARG